MNSSRKPSSLVRNPNNMMLNGGTSSANSNTFSGILLSKDEVFHKNKTFNYPKESNTQRADHYSPIKNMEVRRQRSTKPPIMQVVEAHKTGLPGASGLESAHKRIGSKTGSQHGGVNGNFTPQLIMSSQSES